MGSQEGKAGLDFQDVIGLFSVTQPTKQDTKNLWNEDTDFRQIIFAEWETQKIVIKIACNSFTTPERFKGWLSAMEEYRKSGYYCPRVMENRNGHFCETVSYQGKDCLVWAEEYARFRLADQFEKSFIKNGDTYTYHDDAIRSIGVIGSKHLDFTSWPSGWCIFQPFSPVDPCDERMQCALAFKAYIEDELPAYSDRFRNIWKLYQQNRDQLQAVYSGLPTSVFQGDLNLHNILLDESGHFAGLIDFNLSGRETVLNYLFMEAMWDFGEDAAFYAGDDQPRYFDRDLSRRFDESLRRNLRLACQTYPFSESEKKAAPLLYHYLRPFSDPVIEELKKARDDDVKIGMLLDWIENEITRTDMDFESILG